MTVRTCLDCGAIIDPRAGRLRCKKHAIEANRRSARERIARLTREAREARKEGRIMTTNSIAEPVCETFNVLFDRYVRAGQANIRAEHSTPATVRAVREARAAIMQHRATCPKCADLGAPAPVTNARYPRKPDTVEPLIAIWEAAA